MTTLTAPPTVTTQPSVTAPPGLTARPAPGSRGLRSRLRTRLLTALAVVAALGGLAVVADLPLHGSPDAGAGVSLVAADARTATLSVAALAPGDTVTRTVTIANDDPARARLTFTETGDPATYAAGRLELRIEHDGREVYAGTFGGLADYPLDAGWLEPGASATYSFVVSLPADAPAAGAGTGTATASYSWVTD
ncbi:hypothetical protein [Nocardioides marmotae]|uniref:Uncharacterized protein n=1 Tax=Nocardioides marmotae TaxID=2663857 RepID=A0A6I3J1U0_9ACTN|nr:hypothetical protein [Nocardioides marmotae]MCR6030680.1 hypothetical protein [Gordonia jinghuaiqii]MBC9734137.1 hypothetical protein [Nocardioides marmotae]MTB85240.1 hypothetical protein [Nocardioides marmotae]MTB94316.1 hypothetical protein [Nocardioides marmotae]QKE00588.1 hypothetical protein HPC71_05460 [Nocardioides marmotae]